MSEENSIWQLQDDCFVHDKDRLTYDQAIAFLKSRLGPIASVETVALNSASGRIAASDIFSPRPIPAFDNSAVDGYAVAADALSADAPTTMPISLRVQAGAQARALRLAPGTSARIFTGAVMPSDADTVVMQEDCRLSHDGAQVLMPPGIRAGANVRRAGEDVRAGDLLIEAGTRVRPADVARLASAGIADLAVRRKLKIGILSNGDELRTPGDDLPSGAVFDANAPMLLALAEKLPVEAEFRGIMTDARDDVEALLASAAANCDLILTSGGASKGDADHLQSVLDQLGTSHLWQLAIKPGRPMMMGQIGSTPIFALPGNPVAVFVCWSLFVHPAIMRLAGAPWPAPQRIMVPAGFEISRKKPDRREFCRGWLETADGTTRAMKFERDGSGLIAGLQAATGLLEIPEEVTSVARGDLIAYWPLAQFGTD